MGAVVPYEVTMRDLFLTVRAVLCLVFGGIEVAKLSAELGMLCEITGTEVTFTCWAPAHLKPSYRFAFSWRRVTNVFLATRRGFLSFNGLYHIFSKLKMTKYFGINLMKPNYQKESDFGGQKWRGEPCHFCEKEVCNFGQKS